MSIDYIELTKKLLDGKTSIEEIDILRNGISSGQLTVASALEEKSVAIAGSAANAIISTGDQYFPLSAEVVKELFGHKYKPIKIPKENKKRKRGKIPPGSRLTLPFNYNFTGREQDLLNIAEVFFYFPKKVNKNIVLSSGIGSIGKTQLAIEFCYRYGRYFYGVYWLQADQDISSQIADCGLRTGIFPWPEKQDEQVQKTLNVWKEKIPKLVIFDNLESPDILQEWLPQLSGLHILATSRRSRWPSHLGVKNFSTKELSPEESKSLLVRTAPRFEEDDTLAISDLAERLGFHPLALYLAGRYLDDRPTFSIQNFLDELEKRKDLSHPALTTWAEELGPTAHSTNIITTFDMSWERLGDDQVDKISKGIAIAAGYCAPNIPIPVVIFNEMNIKKDIAIVDKALCRLYDVGLLQSTNDHLPYIHPLVAEFTRTKQNKTTILEKVSTILKDLAIDALDTKLPGNMASYFEHIEYLVSWTEERQVSIVSSLHSILGRFYKMVSRYTDAKE